MIYGISLILMTIFTFMDNKLIKASFKDSVIFRIDNFLQMLEINVHCVLKEIKIRMIFSQFFLNTALNVIKGIRYIYLLKFTLTAFLLYFSFHLCWI